MAAYNARKHKKHIIRIIDENGGDARHCYTDGRVKSIRYKFSTMLWVGEPGFTQTTIDTILAKVREFLDENGIENAVLEWQTKRGWKTNRVMEENLILRIMRG